MPKLTKLPKDIRQRIWLLPKDQAEAKSFLKELVNIHNLLSESGATLKSVKSLMGSIRLSIETEKGDYVRFQQLFKLVEQEIWFYRSWIEKFNQQE